MVSTRRGKERSEESDDKRNTKYSEVSLFLVLGVNLNNLININNDVIIINVEEVLKFFWIEY